MCHTLCHVVYADQLNPLMEYFTHSTVDQTETITGKMRDSVSALYQVLFGLTGRQPTLLVTVPCLFW